MTCGVSFALVAALVLGVLVSAAVEAQECDPAWEGHGTRAVHPRWTPRRSHKPHGKKENLDTLKLVHVVLRHGDRAADDDAMYPLDPYLNFTYYPNGYGQLSNKGKRQEYNIGIELRERYRKFLGEIYTPNVLDGRSTDFNRTKMSLQLVLAGLWPPSKDQLWNDELLWQPIPYNYWRTDEDTLLGDPNVVCPRYQELYNRNLLTDENEEYNENLKSFYDYVNFHTGLNASKVIDIYNVYFTLRAEEGFGLKLPDWTKCVWPDKFLEVAVKQYDLFTQTPELTGLSGGMLLDKIVQDSKDQMEGKLRPEGRKMFLYSAHERNVALTLITLGVFHPHIPPYASYVVMELHQINGEYGFKVYYQDYSAAKPKLLTIPGCDSFCPYDKFYQLIEKNLPKTSCFSLNDL